MWVYHRVVTLVAWLILVSEASCIKPPERWFSCCFLLFSFIPEWGKRRKQQGSWLSYIISLYYQSKPFNQGNDSAVKTTKLLLQWNLADFPAKFRFREQLGETNCNAEEQFVTFSRSGWLLFRKVPLTFLRNSLFSLKFHVPCTQIYTYDSWRYPKSSLSRPPHA